MKTPLHEIIKMKSDSYLRGGEFTRICRTCFVLAMITMIYGITGCASEIPPLIASTQPDGWTAQPIAINNRFTADATRDPISGAPVGDPGYYLSVLTSANYWDYSNSQSFVTSFIKHPWGHTWIILESPNSRRECGHSGNYGVMQPHYHEGVIQGVRDGDPNPIAYLWKTMDDGQYEAGNPGDDPTFVWRVPITMRAFERIDEYILNREYTKFSLSTHNCGDMVTHVASLAGVNLASMVRITFPSEGDVQGHHLRVWTDPKYGTFEIRSIDLLELDLRHLVRLGIGSDVTAAYLASKPYQPLKRSDAPETHAKNDFEQDAEAQ